MEATQTTNSFNEASAKAISLEKAIEIFDWLADMKDIAFGYAHDGCYARAHIMCRRLQETGLMPQKAWAFEGDRYLSVKKPDGNKIRWSWHVTASLPVRMPDGGIQDMVFDPGLFDGPVSLQEWGGIMGASPEQLQIAPFGVSPKGQMGDYDTWSNTDSGTNVEAAVTMQEYLGYQDKSQRVVFPSSSRQQIFQQGQAVQSCAQGETWRAMTPGEMNRPFAGNVVSRAVNWVAGFDLL